MRVSGDLTNGTARGMRNMPMVTLILATIGVVSHMERVYTDGLTKRCMMASGKMDSSMDMGSGRDRRASPILANGSEAWLMAMECTHGRLLVAIAMKVSGAMGSSMAMGLTYSVMVMSISVILKLGSQMEMDSTCGRMVPHTQVSFSMVSNMEKECGSSRKEVQVAHTMVTTEMT